jgi:hypothetical protein
MSGFKTRGYSMIGTLKFIDATYDETAKARIMEQLSPEVRKAIGTYREIEWYDAKHFSELLRGIAKEAGDGDAAAEAALVKSGHFIASIAASTFLRLLMRVLTPSLFAKKIPSLWTRDNQGGAIETDMSEADNGRIVFHVVDVGGYDYIVPVAAGWIAFAMEAMGEKVLERKIIGWSAGEPGPKTARIDLRWQK